MNKENVKEKICSTCIFWAGNCLKNRRNRIAGGQACEDWKATTSDSVSVLLNECFVEGR